MTVSVYGHDTEGVAGSFRRNSLCFSFLVPASASLFGHRVTSSSVEGLDCGTFVCYRHNNELGHLRE